VNLSDCEQRLYDKMVFSGDVSIAVLYRAVKRRWPEPGVTRRSQQQTISPYLVRLRRKLAPHGKTVEPGHARGTYRLSKITG
jgi:hypothetical protein